MASFLSTAGLARMSARHPWRTLGAWLVVLIVAGAISSLVGLNSTTEVVLQNNPESEQGWDALAAHGLRDERPMTETVIVHSDSQKVTDPEFKATVEQLTTAFRSSPDMVASVTNYYEVAAGNPEGATSLVSEDQTTTIIPVTLAGDLDYAVKRAPDFLAILDDQRAGSPGFEVLTVGDGSLNEEINTIAEEDLARGEGIGVVVALAILVVVFGALVAAGLPILLAIVAIATAFGMTALVSTFGELSFLVTNMISMIGLAVGIDYALFIVDRYREERRHGEPRQAAIAVAGATASRAVFFSGLTVILALLGLFIVPNNIYRSFSIGAVLVVLAAVAASLTLMPAMLSLLGDKIEWPRRRSYDAATVAAQERWDHETIHTGFWGTITRVVMRRPIVFTVAATALLLLPAIAFLDIEYGASGPSSLPEETESRAAFEILATDFSAGLVEPVEFVVEGPVDDPAVQQGIDGFVQMLAAERTRDGQPLFGAPAITTSDDREVTLISVPLTLAPDSTAAFDAITYVRAELVPAAEAAMPGTEILVTGQIANSTDFFEARETYTPYVFAFVLGLSFLLLLVVFRSLVIAVKAILMNLLSVGATYGLIVLVFQKGYTAGFFGFQKVEAIEAWLPLMLFTILFGLSMDYHVFLLSRVKEHYDLTKDNRESVAVGLQATARIITGAALIMVAVFAGFAAGRMTALQQTGFGLGVAILIDATIVRSILVPSAMALLGDRNWYLPRWLGWLPRVHLEAPRRTSLPAPAPAIEPTASSD